MRFYIKNAHAPGLFNLLRRTWPLVLLLIIAVVPVGSGLLHAKEPIAAVLSVGMTVSDLERSVDFYSTVLEFRQVSVTEVTGSQDERLNSNTVE